MFIKDGYFIQTLALQGFIFSNYLCYVSDDSFSIFLRKLYLEYLFVRTMLPPSPSLSLLVFILSVLKLEACLD